MKKITILVLILAINISIKAQSINDSITIELTKLSKKSSPCWLWCSHCK